MPLTTDKLKPKEVAEVKKVKTNPKNLHISRDEFISNRRKEKEKAARLKIAEAEIEKQLQAEEDAGNTALENLGAQTGAEEKVTGEEEV